MSGKIAEQSPPKRQKTSEPPAVESDVGVWPIGDGTLGYSTVLQSFPDRDRFYVMEFKPHGNFMTVTFNMEFKSSLAKDERYAGGDPISVWLYRHGAKKRAPVHTTVEFFEWLVSTSLFAISPSTATLIALDSMFKIGLPSSALAQDSEWEGSRLQKAVKFVAENDDAWAHGVRTVAALFFGVVGYDAEPGEVPPLSWYIRQKLPDQFRDFTLETDHHYPRKYGVLPKPHEPPEAEWAQELLMAV